MRRKLYQRKYVVSVLGLDPPTIKKRDIEHDGKKFLENIKTYRYWFLYRFNTKGKDNGPAFHLEGEKRKKNKNETRG